MTEPIKQLLKVLDSLGESASYCTEGSRSPVLPGLHVKGLGEIGVPVSAADAKRLISKASQAPFGRGEETVVDTRVRRVFQLEPRQLSLRNPEWESFVTEIVEAVRTDLGIPQKVEHQLYKLLVYEKGSFFAPHRDSEKSERMFATLVVCLPSRHAGGTLIVTHDGQTRRIELGGADAPFKIRYAAFFADCQHEVLPVTSGHRICLVYNLATVRKKQPVAPKSSAAVMAVSALLGRLFEDRSRDKVAIPLRHQYTRAALDPGELKGGDRARVDVLLRAAERSGCQAFLALMTHHQEGSADEGSLSYRSSRSRGWHDEDEDEDDDGDGGFASDPGAQFEDICEESLTLDHWLDASGRKQPFGEMRLDESEILSEVAPQDRPYETHVHPPTGNEGVSMDRWYRQTVVVIWPRDRFFAILAGEGPRSAIPALEKLLKGKKKPAGDASGLAFAEVIVARWPASTGSNWRAASDGEASPCRRMLPLLDRLGSTELAVRFVRDILPDHCDGSEGQALARLVHRLGWTRFAESLHAVFAKQAPDQRDRTLAIPVALFEALCSGSMKMTGERQAVCSDLAADLVQALDRFDGPASGAWWAESEKRTGLVERVFGAFAAIGDTGRLDAFVSRTLGDPVRYDLHTVLIPAVKVLFSKATAGSAARPAWDRLHRHCLEELRSRTATRPEPPRDWTREATVACTCADCRELNAFLKSPNEEIHRFPRRKDLRQHLHRSIERHECDLTHVTVRKGSPQTLVCTKTNASHDRRLAQFEVDTELLSEMEALAGPGTAPGTPESAAIGPRGRKPRAPAPPPSPSRRAVRTGGSPRPRG